MKLYDSLSGQKKEFVPLAPPAVKMYCCGPTVYDLLHVGNFRGAVVYNLLRNWLETLGYQVTFVYNYTDIDDKIIQRAQKDGVSSERISEKYIAEFEKDFARLGLKKHSHNPKVSDFLTPIISMIQGLIDKGHAYVNESGEVLYSVRAFAEYGKLSHRSVDDMRTGTRVAVGERKQDPLDFALWKPAKEGEPSWPSPWGAGRPGWHIECSAMSRELLGEQIDIHGGGIDLMFPHHENEIAQSEGCSGHSYVRYWVHNNLIEFSGAKMSKSLGNIVTGRAFMDEYHPEVLKFLFLSSHYRSVLSLSDDSIMGALRGLARIYSALARAEILVHESGGGMARSAASLQVVAAVSSSAMGASAPESVRAELSTEDSFAKVLATADVKIREALNEDLATPEVMANLFEVIRAFNTLHPGGFAKKEKDPVLAGARARALRNFIVHTWGRQFALFAETPAEFLMALDDLLLKKMNLSRENVQSLVDQRWQARLQKNFAESDRLRDQLLAMGIAVMDSPQGSAWEVNK